MLLTELSDAREAEIRALVSDPNAVFFVKCSYSYNELLAVLKQIEQNDLFTDKIEIVGAGIGWTSDENGVRGFGENGFENRVCIEVLEEYYDKYVSLLGGQYGDMVDVSIGEIAIPQTGDAESPAGTAAIGAALALAAVVVTASKRRAG